MKRSTKLLLVAVGVASMLGAARWLAALSVGDLVVEGTGGAFRALVPLSLTRTERAEEVRVSIGSARDYTRMGLARPPVADQLSVVMDRQAANPVARLFARQPLHDYPFDLVVRVSVGEGSVLRHFRVVAPPSALAGEDQTASIYGPVRRGETLFSIAERVSGGRFDPHRVSVAIWSRNQDQFIRGNLHGLRAGSLLDLARLEEDVATLSAAEARETVQSQWAAWRARKQTAQAALPTKEEKEPVVVVAAPAEDWGPVVYAANAMAEQMTRAVAPTSPGDSAREPSVRLAAVTVSPRLAPSPPGGVFVATLKELPSVTELKREVTLMKEQLRSSSDEVSWQLALLRQEVRRQASSAEISRQRFTRFLYIFIGENLVLLTILLSLRAHKRLREAKRIRARRQATLRLLERSLREKVV